MSLSHVFILFLLIGKNEKGNILDTGEKKWKIIYLINPIGIEYHPVSNTFSYELVELAVAKRIENIIIGIRGSGAEIIPAEGDDLVWAIAVGFFIGKELSFLNFFERKPLFYVLVKMMPFGFYMGKAFHKGEDTYTTHGKVGFGFKFPVMGSVEFGYRRIIYSEIEERHKNDFFLMFKVTIDKYEY